MKVKVKLICCLLLISLLSISFISAKGVKERETSNTLNVYATKSFAGNWGAGPILKEDYAKKTNIDINYVIVGSATSIIPKLYLEKSNSNADIIIGITDQDLAQALKLDYFNPLNVDLSKIKDEILLDKHNTLVPYDMGYYAFNYNSEIVKDVPKNFNDLTKPIYKNKIIISDPRTSSTGFGLLVWSILALGEDKAFDWWRNIKPNLLTIAEDWSGAYTLFSNKEAPIMFGFSTSVIWEVDGDKKPINLPAKFEEPLMPTIEYLGVSKYSKNKIKAQKFVKYLLNEGQEAITNANKMFSVNKDFNYPKSFDWAIKSDNILEYNLEYIENNKEKWITKWTNIMIQ